MVSLWGRLSLGVLAMVSVLQFFFLPEDRPQIRRAKAPEPPSL